jgi:hypothetical protein
VSADCQLPPLSVKDKCVLATEDSFDYSSFIVAGLLTGYSQVTNAYPEFHQGAAGYGRYYWHSFAEQAVGNYFTEAIVPSLTHEDPRYYTLGHGSLFHRTGYAISRLLVTKTDSAGRVSIFPRSSATAPERPFRMRTTRRSSAPGATRCQSGRHTSAWTTSRIF